MSRFIRSLLLALPLFAASAAGHSAPILQSISPIAINFTFGAGADFTVATGTGFGDVTAAVLAVDLVIPSPFINASTSGCEAADFAGFAAGSIALIQRGTCTFAIKAQNAETAGAAGVLLFNEGNPGRVDATSVTLSPFTASVPVFFASFGVGDLVSGGTLNGPTGFVVRMSVTPDDLLAMPEPSSVALLAFALAGLAAWRRRKD